MSLDYKDLDDITRRFMMEEIKYDKDNNNFYLSNFLSIQGKQEWPSLLEESVQHDDEWLEQEIQKRKMLGEYYPRRKPRSTEMTQARVPVTAAKTLAEGEFNRLYARGLCSRVISEGNYVVEAYRARYSASPRPESESIIGKRFIPQDILQDLRTSQGVDSAIGVPPGPNSGISIKRIDK